MILSIVGGSLFTFFSFFFSVLCTDKVGCRLHMYTHHDYAGSCFPGGNSLVDNINIGDKGRAMHDWYSITDFPILRRRANPAETRIRSSFAFIHVEFLKIFYLSINFQISIGTINQHRGWKEHQPQIAASIVNDNWSNCAGAKFLLTSSYFFSHALLCIVLFIFLIFFIYTFVISVIRGSPCRFRRFSHSR